MRGQTFSMNEIIQQLFQVLIIELRVPACGAVVFLEAGSELNPIQDFSHFMASLALVNVR